MAELRALTRPLADVVDGELDLNDVARDDGVLFVRDGIGVAGREIATRLPIDGAAEVLSTIPHDAPAGAPPVRALGSVPFRPGAPAEVTVPAVSVIKTAAGAWVTTVAAEPHLIDVAASIVDHDPPTPCAPSWTITPTVAEAHYLAAVAAARNAVRDGAVAKAVIARPIEVAADRPISVHAVLRRLRATFASSYRFSIDGFVGASPELLVEVDATTIRSHPLAGTTARTGDPDNDQRLAAELQASAKNQIEHRVVIDDVHDRLLRYVSYLDWEPEPSIVAVANVQHLRTRLEGQLSSPTPSVVELVRALSPTPALGGYPRSTALELIKRVEGFDRGRYGGAVGWVDARGDGTWAVAIRGAEFSVDRRSARLVAGGGIVADSDPLAELAETQAKFQAMLSAIIRP